MRGAPDQVLGWTISDWQEGYRSNAIAPEILVNCARAWNARDTAWTQLASAAEIEIQLFELAELLHNVHGDKAKLPLYGVPFAVKDNIHVTRFETTAGCPGYAFRPKEDAAVIKRLRALGAIVMGKTNLDQFATGLVGVRSPYGVVPSLFDERRIGGGSSSGSASVVARGLVPFALGTDTAGSGRVPASFQNIVGLKPTRGRISTTGLVPACRTLDCISVFSLTVGDAGYVLGLAEGFDEHDEYCRRVPPLLPPRPEGVFAVPRKPEFFGDELAREAFDKALALLVQTGASLVEIDFTPFQELAALLYQGPWVAERTVAVEKLLDEEPTALHPVVRQIIENGRRFSAMDAFRAEYERAYLARVIDEVLKPFSALILPTTPTNYTIEAVLSDPIGANSRLGTFTNFANLADLSAVAVPGPFRGDGLPAGITFFAPAFYDEHLTSVATEFQRVAGLELGKTGRALPQAVSTATKPAPTHLDIAVVGAHLTGLPLNHELTRLGAVFQKATATAPLYRMFALPGTQPPKPGMVRVKEGGVSLEVEVWRLPIDGVGLFLAGIPSPLGIGKVELLDGTWVHGFLCEGAATEGALEISEFGGFRAYLASLGH